MLTTSKLSQLTTCMHTFVHLKSSKASAGLSCTQRRKRKIICNFDCTVDSDDTLDCIPGSSKRSDHCAVKIVVQLFLPWLQRTAAADVVCRFPGKARALADSVQAWTDMQEANAQAFSNKLEASFLHGGRHAPKAASPISNDSRRTSSESLVTPASSPTRSATRTSSTKRAVLVAR